MSQKTKVLIAEDEVLISEQLKDILEDLGYEVTDIAYDFDSATHSIAQNPPDLALLDIVMLGENQGFDIARHINEKSGIPFVFLTSSSDKETVEEAANLNPASYLVKPFSRNDIFSTLAVVVKSRITNQQTITVKVGSIKLKLKTADILWVNASDVYIEIQTTSKKHLVRASLNAFLEEHELHNFQRTHRSYAINMNHVDAVNGKFVVIRGEEIPLSRNFKDAVWEAFDGLNK